MEIIQNLAKPMGSRRPPPFARLKDAIDTLAPTERNKLQRILRALPYQKFLQSAYWRSVRAELLRLRGSRCQSCHLPLEAQVHHTSYAQRGNEHENLDHLRILCAQCHRKTQEEFDRLRAVLGKDANEFLSTFSFGGRRS